MLYPTELRVHEVAMVATGQGDGDVLGHTTFRWRLRSDN